MYFLAAGVIKEKVKGRILEGFFFPSNYPNFMQAKSESGADEVSLTKSK